MVGLRHSEPSSFASIRQSSCCELIGSGHYREWSRSLEIVLSSKRKLGFVDGSLERDSTDATKGEQWDTCNSMVVAWILACVSDSIKKSILFMNSPSAIWKQLKTRFTQSSGSRKYRLNRDVYKLKQKGKSVSEYYTSLQTLREEIDSLNILPSLSRMNVEVTAFVKALNTRKEEQHLFQFLNGLDEDYNAQRSQILIMATMPSVEQACGMIQQEEAQRDLLRHVKEDYEVTAMMSSEGGCTAYGGKVHNAGRSMDTPSGIHSIRDNNRLKPKKVETNGLRENHFRVKVKNLQQKLRVKGFHHLQHIKWNNYSSCCHQVQVQLRNPAMRLKKKLTLHLQV